MGKRATSLNGRPSSAPSRNDYLPLTESTSNQFGSRLSSAMQSLRTSRPSEPIKRSISKLTKSTSIRQNARKSTVDDKIKKRMSLRYAEISLPTEASVPAVPTVPLEPRLGAARDPDEIVRNTSEIKEDPRVADQRLLDNEDFDPDTCKSPQQTPVRVLIC